MKTSHFRLLVMVPHRDIRLPLRAWSASLFSAGVPGAWSFPWVTPLAQISRPLSGEELRSLAHSLRSRINSEGGIVTAGPPGISILSPESGGMEITIFGPSLPVTLPDDFFKPADEAVTRRIVPPILGVSLLYGSLPDALPAPPQSAFRAAALANMRCRLLPLGDNGESGYSFEWKMGKLHWLPRKADSVL
jgi:hypothetical protein